MHQGRSRAASSSYLQSAIRRGQTRIPQHTVRTSNPYFIIHRQMLNAVHCRQRLGVRCDIELSGHLKAMNARVFRRVIWSFVACCWFVCGW